MKHGSEDPQVASDLSVSRDRDAGSSAPNGGPLLGRRVREAGPAPAAPRSLADLSEAQIEQLLSDVEWLRLSEGEEELLRRVWDAYGRGKAIRLLARVDTRRLLKKRERDKWRPWIRAMKKALAQSEARDAKHRKHFDAIHRNFWGKDALQSGRDHTTPGRGGLKPRQNIKRHGFQRAIDGSGEPKDLGRREDWDDIEAGGAQGLSTWQLRLGSDGLFPDPELERDTRKLIREHKRQREHERLVKLAREVQALVDEGWGPVADVCKAMGIPPATFYRLGKHW
jgi:hypothetical protein